MRMNVWYGWVHAIQDPDQKTDRSLEWMKNENTIKRMQRRRRRRRHSFCSPLIQFTSEMEKKKMKKKMPKTAEVLFFISVTLFSSRLLVVAWCWCVRVCSVCFVLYHYFYRRCRRSTQVVLPPFQSIAFYCDVKWWARFSMATNTKKKRKWIVHHHFPSPPPSPSPNFLIRTTNFRGHHRKRQIYKMFSSP